MSRRVQLPEMAATYLESLSGHQLRGARSVLHLFHNWLDASNLTLENLRVEQIERFLIQPRARVISDTSRTVYRHHIRRYVTWLYARQACRIDPRTLDRRPTPPTLPNSAEQFVTQLAPTRRPNTIRRLRIGLRCFHRWLEEHDIAVEDVARDDMLQWAQHLFERGLAPVTRRGMLTTVRMYLWHLAEKGVLRESPDALVRRSDLPKLPKYLPRPLPPDVDQELQRRLEASSSPLRWGLLLMRNTGLRISELRALRSDCLRIDESGRRLLKVPLGKLYSERLVPVDDGTVQVIERLLAAGPNNRRSWLVQTAPDRQTSENRLRRALCVACTGIETAEPITSHRLRHTYATTLLNAGMSLTGLMHLLGHRDIRMTLRYAAVTLESVGHDYFQALDALEKRYRSGIHRPSENELDPTQALSDIIRLIKRQTPTIAGTDQRRARLLIRRLERMRKDLIAFPLSLPKRPPP